MDLSLVLVSQGIETTITPPGDENGWELRISAADHEQAEAALQQYRRENRRWPWRQEVLKPGLLFDWGALAWLALAVFFYALETRIELRTVGRVDNAALAAGEWWRLFTAIWLHADIGHIAANLSIGLVLLGLVMGLYGTGVGLLAAYLAGAAGNVMSWLCSQPPHLSLGASGMIMGCLGLLAVQSVSHIRRNPGAAKLVIGGIAGGVMLFALLGLAPETDVLAHFGGFLGGLVIGIPLNLRPALAREAKINMICGFVFAALVVLPWWLALNRASHP